MSCKIKQKIPAKTNRLVGQAMHRYSMLADGDRVLIAVSGGVDSLVLCHLLVLWQQKAPLNLELFPVFLEMGFPEAEDLKGSKKKERRLSVAAEVAKCGLKLYSEQTDFGAIALDSEEGKNTCYHCSKLRRNRLFELAREKNCNKLALGHHRDDLIETFFINLLYGGNISTAVPCQQLFSGRLQIIRPLALLEKAAVCELAEIFNLVPTKNYCPRHDSSQRSQVREMLETLNDKDPRIKASIFAALSNIRKDYLL